jgi:transcriptional regulator with XRE-family HTH domain
MKQSFTGNDVRDIRKSLGLSRAEMGSVLGVAAVTVEKWEQSGDKTIRSKYFGKLMELSGAGFAGAGIGFVAAPAILGVAAATAIGALAASALIGDKELDEAIGMMERLRKLSPEERKTLVELLLKANSQT